MSDCVRHNYRIIIGGDFNTQCDVGDRGRKLHELCDAFQLDILNNAGTGRNDSHWTFRSCLGVFRRIDFILASNTPDSQSCDPSDDINMGSDHRSVKAILNIGCNRPRFVKHKSKQKIRQW